MFINLAHGLDHFVLLIYPTAAIAMGPVFSRSYPEMIALTAASSVTFGVFSLPAGWLADRWSCRNMMALFYIGCGISLAGAALAPNLLVLLLALLALGMFASVYHPVGMAILIEASQASGRSLALNGACGNLGVALAAGTTTLLISALTWRAAFLIPGLVCAFAGVAYVFCTNGVGREGPHTRSHSRPQIGQRFAALLVGSIILITLTGSTTFNVLTIALPKIVKERLLTDVPLLLAGMITSGMLLWGGLAQLCIGRLLDRFRPQTLLAAITSIGCVCNLGAAQCHGILLAVCLAGAVGANFGQVTITDMLLALYTAEAWRGRVYAMRYFLVFISTVGAVSMISLLYDRGGFDLVLRVNAVASLVGLLATAILVLSLENTGDYKRG